MQRSVIIIGAGFGGLAAAALLAKDGYKVTVVEKNSGPGGRAQRLQAEGFTFDMGPSWYLMPDVFDRFFGLFGYQPTDFFKLKPLDPQYRVYFGDGTHVDIASDLATNLELFEQLEAGSSKKFLQYLQLAEKKYQLAIEHFLYSNQDSLLDFISLPTIRYGLTLGLLSSMKDHVKRFFKTEKMQQLVQYTLVFLGGAPHNTPALFSLMSHVDFNLNVFYPEEGMWSVVKALVKLGEGHGVSYLYNHQVEQLETTHGRVTKVKTNQGEFSADIVIGNADLKHFEDLLLDQSQRQYSSTYWSKAKLAPSAYLMYLGVKGKLPKLHHHTLVFGQDWTQHFHQIFEQPQWPQRPSLYINMPSATDRKVSPKGHHNLMVLVPVASGLSEDLSWKQHYGDYILGHVERSTGVSLQSKIVYRSEFSVSDFATTYNSLGGNALGGLAHTLFQSAIWRPKNYHRSLKNVYFVGANTVPGIGVPPALISAELVVKRIKQMLK